MQGQFIVTWFVDGLNGWLSVHLGLRCDEEAGVGGAELAAGQDWSRERG